MEEWKIGMVEEWGDSTIRQLEEWKIGMVEEWGDSTIRQFENLRMEDCNCPLATGDCRLLSADFPLRFALCKK